MEKKGKIYTRTCHHLSPRRRGCFLKENMEGGAAEGCVLFPDLEFHYVCVPFSLGICERLGGGRICVCVCLCVCVCGFASVCDLELGCSWLVYSKMCVYVSVFNV